MPSRKFRGQKSSGLPPRNEDRSGLPHFYNPTAMKPYERDYRLLVPRIGEYVAPESLSKVETLIVMMKGYNYNDAEILDHTGLDPEEYYQLISQREMMNNILLAQRERERVLLHQAGFRLKNGFLAAIDFNLAILSDPESTNAEKFQASKLIADLTMKSFELQQKTMELHQQGQIPDPDPDLESLLDYMKEAGLDNTYENLTGSSFKELESSLILESSENG